MPKVNLLTFGMFLLISISAFIFLVGNNSENNSKELEIVECEIISVVKTVRGLSMSPLLQPEQEVKLLEGYYKCNSPKIGDVVVVNHANREVPLIKVIKAVPDDKFQVVRKGDFYQIVVNDNELINSVGEHYLLSEKEAKMIDLYVRDYRGVIPKDAYLILGDNVSSSLDSTEFGLVGKDSLIGKVDI